MTLSSGDSNAMIGTIQKELTEMEIKYDQLSCELNSTRVERDSTVSDMRQEIERLNLLHGDQR